MKFAVITFGCRVNAAEGTQLEQELQKLKLGRSDSKKADLIIINSCAITGRAVRQVRQEINKIKKINPNCHILVTGCAATMWDKNKVKPEKVDFVVNNQNKQFLAKFIKQEFLSSKSIKAGVDRTYDKFLNSSRLMVKVQDGCDYFCTYCIVPHLRGRSVSLKTKNIIKYINSVSKKAVINEVILTGINLGLYQGNFNSDFTELIKQVLINTSIPKISFGSLYKENLTDDFINLYQSDYKNRLTKYLHIPIQSASDKILSLMHRRYTLKEFDERIGLLHKQVPDALLATDVIVGFYEESDKDFTDTYEYFDKSPFVRAHIFKYSKREFTAGFYMTNKFKEPSSEVKKKRSLLLHQLFDKKLSIYKQSLVGKVFLVLIIKQKTNSLLGFLSNGLEVIIPSEKRLDNVFVDVKISAVKNSILIGKITN